MIRGTFGPITSRPFVLARFALPRLGARGATWIQIDTGADVSCLMPADVALLQIPYESFGPVQSIIGITGMAGFRMEDAVLIFEDLDSDTMHAYSTRLFVAPPDPHLADQPSVLGRDILHSWDMHYRPLFETIEIDPINRGVSSPRSPFLVSLQPPNGPR